MTMTMTATQQSIKHGGQTAAQAQSSKQQENTATQLVGKQDHTVGRSQ